MNTRTSEANMAVMSDAAKEIARRNAEEKAREGELIEATAGRLHEIAKEIRQHNRTAEGILASAIPHYMDIADLLIEARELHPGDKEYGRWRSDVLPEFSATWCSRLVQIRQSEALQPIIKDNLMSISQLSELVSVPREETLVSIVEQVRSDKPMTVKEIRQAKKDACPECGSVGVHADGCTTKNEQVIAVATSQAKPRPPGPAMPNTRKPKTPAPLPIELQAREQVAKSFPKRLSAFNSSGGPIESDPFIVLGVGSNFTDTLPNPLVLDLVVEHWRFFVEENMAPAMQELFTEVVDLAYDYKTDEAHSVRED